jgi:hypothetical protein
MLCQQENVPDLNYNRLCELRMGVKESKVSSAAGARRMLMGLRGKGPSLKNQIMSGLGRSLLHTGNMSCRSYRCKLTPLALPRSLRGVAHLHLTCFLLVACPDLF